MTGLALLLLPAATAGAAAQLPVTYQDAVYASGASATSPPSSDKPQSKLWFNDGSWWALMLGSSSVNIYKLGADHVWANTGTVVDNRVTSTGDALWTNNKLYVASRTAGTGGAIRLYRYSYSTTTGKYTKDSGFPIGLGGKGGSESVTIDRDTIGRLWITFTRSSTVWVSHSSGSDTSWGAPFKIPGADTAVKADDISALLSLNGKIGVFWSDQQSQGFRFALHNDTDPDNVWSYEVPLAGTRIADDHMNLKSLLGDDQGRVYAAVKTSLGDDPSDPATSPNIVVLTRTSSGAWSSATASQKSLNLTRPQLALDRTNRQLILLDSDEGGGKVYYKTAPLGGVTNAAFNPAQKGSSFMSWSGASINNVATTKDPVDATTGLVAIATDSVARRYYHGEMALGSGDSTPPTVVAKTPAAGATGVDAGTQVTAKFSEPMTSASITTSTVQLTGPGTTAVPATVSYDTTSLTATLTPTSALALGTTYTATVTTGVADQAGNALAAPVTWSFTTVAPDTTKPTVVTKAPAANASDVAVTSPVTATFSEQMTASTITGTSFTLTSGSGSVAANVSYDAPTTTATLTPTSPLAAGTTYTATVTTAVKDLSGNALAANESWTFTTGVPDTTKPTVSGNTPGNNAVDVTLGTVPTATFSEPMNSGTLTTTSFALSGPSGNVPATVSYNASTRTASLAPTSQLAPGATYTATVTTGAADLAGNGLAAPYSWSFSTVAAAPNETLDPTADTYVSSDTPTTNFGSATSLVTDGTPDAKTFLKYDLSAYAGRTLQSATLVVPVTDSGSVGTQNVRLTLKDTWTEAGLTYSNKPGVGTTLGNLSGTSPGTTYSVPLSLSDVQAKLGGVLSLAFASSSADDLIVGSREGGTPVQLVLVLQ